MVLLILKNSTFTWLLNVSFALLSKKRKFVLAEEKSIYLTLEQVDRKKISNVIPTAGGTRKHTGLTFSEISNRGCQINHLLIVVLFLTRRLEETLGNVEWNLCKVCKTFRSWFNFKRLG